MSRIQYTEEHCAINYKINEIGENIVVEYCNTMVKNTGDHYPSTTNSLDIFVVEESILTSESSPLVSYDEHCDFNYRVSTGNTKYCTTIFYYLDGAYNEYFELYQI